MYIVFIIIYYKIESLYCNIDKNFDLILQIAITGFAREEVLKGFE